MDRLSFCESYSVKPAPDGKVALEFIVDPSAVHDVVVFLESLSTFFQRIDSLSRQRRQRKTDQAVALIQAEGERFRHEYVERVTSSFDCLIDLGYSRKDAIRKTAADLRAENHPWCAVVQVRDTILQERPGKPGRPALR